MLLKVVPYRPEWPSIFDGWRYRIATRVSLSEIAVDHVGSTAVPALEAKPVIDIQLRVPNVDEAKIVLVRDLEPLGLEYRAEVYQDRIPPWVESSEIAWHKLYFRTSHDIEHPVHMHVRAFGQPNARYALLLRDYLRGHGVARTAYGKFKLLLSEQTADRSTPGGTGAYLDLKDPILDLLYHAAEQWANQVDWKC